MPIGYYLKKVDNLLTSGINQIHGAYGLTRTDWQILNTIQERGRMDRQGLFEILSGIENFELINKAVSGLIHKDLLKEGKELALTGEGEKVYQSCLEKQVGFRKKSMENISEQEYGQIIATLEKIIHNLQ